VADRILGLIRAIYNWGNATGALEVNPTLGLKKRNTGRPRERVLDDDEIRALWRRLDTPSKLSQGIRDSLKLQLLLGVRISEAIGAAKNEFDLKRQMWIIPAERTKGDREHRLPLSPLAMTIIESAMERSGTSAWLFPSSLDGASMRSRSATRAVIRFRSSVSLGDIGTHDLRRTMATGLGDMDIPEEMIERVLNHAPRTVAGRHYNHAKYAGPLKRALDAWADRLQAIIDNHSNVVVLRARKFDKAEAAPDTHLAGQVDADAVGAMVRLQYLSEEYQRIRHHDDVGRKCVIEALHAAISIFGCNMSTAWAEDLASQLGELDCGTVGPMLTRAPRDRRGAPERRVQKAVLRIFGCAYMSMLIEAGMSVSDADAKVKQRMKSRFSHAGAPLTRHTLINWRRQMTSKKGRRTPDAEIYVQLLKRTGGMPRTVKAVDEWVDSWIKAPF
jgi:integrase-like protein